MASDHAATVVVTPAQAGAHVTTTNWILAFAGMT
jgi:hypothetical protein